METDGKPSSPGGSRESFPEKQFYLDEFHEKTLLFALAPGAGRGAEAQTFVKTVEELAREEVRSIVVVSDRDVAARLEERLRRRAIQAGFRSARDSDTSTLVAADEAGEELDLDVLLRLWNVLRTVPIVVLRLRRSPWTQAARYATRLGTRLGVYKLVLVDPEGPIEGPGIPTFLDEKILSSLLSPGEAEWVGLGHRRHLIETIRKGLVDGIPSISLCRPSGVPRELFTYEGSGTLFTLEDYCKVDRLSIDDFQEVERILERGQQEGFLKRRSRKEIGEILFTGYGARIGSGHLAGVGSLHVEPYRDERAGEIAALYTITRFHGEGVGARILDRMLRDGRERGLRYVFACTTQERAMQFFARHGFRRVPSGDVPQAKWKDYEADRQGLVSVFRKDLES